MEDEFCKRNSLYGVCSGCRDAHKSGCAPIDPPFRRAVNMLMFLVDHATRKSINAFKDGGYNDSEEMDMYDNHEDL
ncbi:hypothetical protein AA0118_g6316 [Alternaria tenuissima]|nr:hypothetical protein AA0118_g6316 [Alternaria tenuissima]